MNKRKFCQVLICRHKLPLQKGSYWRMTIYNKHNPHSYCEITTVCFDNILRFLRNELPKQAK